MHTEDISEWIHDHRFGSDGHAESEGRTKVVVGITATMMIAEILVGSRCHSMALLADGFHMSTHVAALGITAFAYQHARKYADDRRYTFGTGKVSSSSPDINRRIGPEILPRTLKRSLDVLIEQGVVKFRVSSDIRG